MPLFSFTLQVSQIDPTAAALDSAVPRDAAAVTVIGKNTYLRFRREAASLNTALQAATERIERAGGTVVGGWL
jgi:hypothetical protein